MRIYSGDVFSIPGEWSRAGEDTGAPRWQEAMAQTSLVYARPSYDGDVIGEV